MELGFVDKNVIILVAEFIVIALVSATGREGLMLDISYVTGQYVGLTKKLANAEVVCAPLLMI